ncbi:MAG: hypothetical protein KIH01_00825 [Candidatus Freyarchaeota archaeon]|nr:hypothetical protein [Candidatus Jordarchaeia archaeon]
MLWWLITGIAAALSMASLEYLSTKSEDGGRSSFKAASYTEATYIITVFLLIPFIVLEDIPLCLGVTVVNVIVAIFLFMFYMSVARDLPFRRRFLEMVRIILWSSSELRLRVPCGGCFSAWKRNFPATPPT